ncbi:MAG TPA: hypothetical protein VGA19_09255 [Rhodospirillales bacterium]|jgi:hypothetical protein
MKSLLSMLGVGILAVVVAGGPARAQWEDALREDARIELGCVVAFLTQVIVRSDQGQTIVTAKVHCEDKRTFDARQEGEYQVFTFKPCQDPNARAC